MGVGFVSGIPPSGGKPESVLVFLMFCCQSRENMGWVGKKRMLTWQMGIFTRAEISRLTACFPIHTLQDAGVITFNTASQELAFTDHVRSMREGNVSVGTCSCVYGGGGLRVYPVLVLPGGRVCPAWGGGGYILSLLFLGRGGWYPNQRSDLGGRNGRGDTLTRWPYPLPSPFVWVWSLDVNTA